MGSVRQITNVSGSVTYGQAFDPFGTLMAASGLGGSNFGYAGEWTDASGLQYLRARYYSPATGRFISKDPFPGLLTQPASLTPYVYALNNPVLLNDPSGEFAFIPILLVGAAGGLLGGAIYGYGSQVVNNLNRGMCFWDALSTNINAGQVGLYAGAGTIIGAALGSGIYGAWWAGLQMGWWGGVSTGTYTVYRYFEHGITRYIGQTSNFVQRAQSHLRYRGWNIEPIKGLTRLSQFDARAVEQVLIEHYGLPNLYNRINSISVNDVLYEHAIKRGIEILNMIGFFR